MGAVLPVDRRTREQKLLESWLRLFAETKEIKDGLRVKLLDDPTEFAEMLVKYPVRIAIHQNLKLLMNAPWVPARKYGYAVTDVRGELWRRGRYVDFEAEVFTGIGDEMELFKVYQAHQDYDRMRRGKSRPTLHSRTQFQEQILKNSFKDFQVNTLKTMFDERCGFSEVVAETIIDFTGATLSIPDVSGMRIFRERKPLTKKNSYVYDVDFDILRVLWKKYNRSGGGFTPARWIQTHLTQSHVLASYQAPFFFYKVVEVSGEPEYFALILSRRN